MTKLIFLDIDGVLNSIESAAAIFKITGKRVVSGPVFVEEPFTRENLNWSAKLVSNLREIVDSTGASVVISSTWREKFWAGQFIDMFNQYGWFNAPIIGITPRYLTNRGVEIDEWISDTRRRYVTIDNYVIIDDNDDFSDIQKEMHLVLVDSTYGLRKEDVQKAIMILGGE